MAIILLWKDGEGIFLDAKTVFLVSHFKIVSADMFVPAFPYLRVVTRSPRLDEANCRISEPL